MFAFNPDWYRNALARFHDQRRTRMLWARRAKESGHLRDARMFVRMAREINREIVAYKRGQTARRRGNPLLAGALREATNAYRTAFEAGYMAEENALRIEV